MSETVIGIDPGLTGSVAILSRAGEVLLLEDLPTIANGQSAKVGRKIDPAGLADLLKPYTRNTRVILERVSARPGQGTASIFSLGDSNGCIRGVLATLEIPTVFSPPTKWKPYFHLGNDKEQARSKAIELFPGMASRLQRKADHNRAEALLLAEWGRRTQG